MKKIISMLLAVVCAFGLSTMAFAVNGGETDTPLAPGDKFTIQKQYNTKGIAPDETFKFTSECVSVTDAGTGITTKSTNLTVGDVSFDNNTEDYNKSRDVTVTLPEYTNVGIYTYKVTETATNTAGVTISEPIFVEVSVYQDGAIEGKTDGKLDCFVNVYNITEKGEKGEKTEGFIDIKGDGKVKNANVYEAGSLAVSKTVTGKLGDHEKEFKVTVTFKAPTDKTVNSTISYGKTGESAKTLTFAEGATTATAEITLKHDETVTFTNIPAGVTYTVVEDDYTTKADGEYDEASYAYSDESKTITSTEKDTVAITNNKGGEIRTGVLLDTAPYFLIAVLALGGVALVMKKRYEV